MSAAQIAGKLREQKTGNKWKCNIYIVAHRQTHLGVPDTPQSYLYMPLMYLQLPITLLALRPFLIYCYVWFWLQISSQIPKR